MKGEKIRAIRSYLCQQGVRYYDVQAELIDHFATAVEKEEKENPDISFKIALLKAHRSFGGREGFRKYILQANKNVQKKTNRLVFLTFLQFLKWPYMVATISIAAFWYFTIPAITFDIDFLFVAYFIAFLAIGLFNYVSLRNISWYLPRRANIALGSFFYFVFYLPLYIGVFKGTESWNPILMTIFLTSLSIGVYAFWVVPKKLIVETEKMYPQIA